MATAQRSPLPSHDALQSERKALYYRFLSVMSDVDVLMECNNAMIVESKMLLMEQRLRKSLDSH